MDPVLPPVWSDEALENDRSIAVAQFKHQRITEPLEAYLEHFDRYQWEPTPGEVPWWKKNKPKESNNEKP